MTRTANTFAPPIVAARRWLDGITFAPERPLLNVSQAAPMLPPPEALRRHIADIALSDPAVHLYGPVLGLPELRAALARQISTHYGGAVDPDQVAITTGCNQAFAAAISALTGEGDEVILPVPWYFNHKMCLDMSGVTAVPLPVGADLLPDPATAAGLITPRTRAIALVSPNNPAGVEYPADLIAGFRDLARARGIRLILDETYRDFHSLTGPPHPLFADPGWDDTLVHLYSFSKAYRLTGHRVGALATSRALLGEIEKNLDTVTICPNQIGQRAALWGIDNLAGWLADQRDDILARRAAIADGFAPLEERGWRLRGLGAYFAYVAHPFDMPSEALARALVAEAGILMLPATMFMPVGDPSGTRHLRIAFANIDRADIDEMFARLSALPF